MVGEISDDYYVPADPSHIKKEKQKARDLRKSQWWRQKIAGRTCHYCGGEFQMDDLTMDHVIPVARGGRSTKGNVVPSCKECNTKKKHLTPAEIQLQKQADLNKNSGK